MRKTIFTISFPVTLTFDFRTQICSVTLVQRYVSTKLEVSTAFLLYANKIGGTERKDGQTDGMRHFTGPLWRAA